MQRTEEQEAICKAAANGENIIVDALAGCAKSTTIIELLKDCGKEPTNVLAFNTKIKKEMEAKIAEAKISRPNLEVLTLNGLGHRAIGRALGRNPTLDNDKIYSLTKDVGVKGDDFADLMFLVRQGRNMGIVPKGMAGNSLVEDHISVWEELADANDIDPILAVPARDILQKSVKAALGGTIDFDDQIYISSLIFGSFARQDRVIVDESQDLSPLNHIQLRKLAKRQLIAVGDPNQAIYAWRGADSESMKNLELLRPEWTHLGLTTTFRCPKSVVARQQEFVPKFKAGPNNKEGLVRGLGRWSPILGSTSAIICRNNAPLIKLAFRMIRESVPINFLGQDIGKNMKRFYNKISNKGKLPPAKVIEELEGMLLNPDCDVDKCESLLALLQGNPNIDEALAFLTDSKSKAITITSGHRSKGLEWENVYFLEPQLIPNRRAEAAGGAALQQEYNLKYVIETRTKNNLFFVQGAKFSAEA